MSDILKIAEQLNSDVTRLNNERSKLEGMLESAKSNYERAVKAYEVKFGTKLTESNMQSEYNDVYARTKGAVLTLQEHIEYIKSGAYKNDTDKVSFDLEPSVTPIKGEVKKESKRGRKSKVDSVKVSDVVEPELVVSTGVEPELVESASVEPAIADGPFNFSLDDSVPSLSTSSDSPINFGIDFDGFAGFDTTSAAPAPVSSVVAPISPSTNKVMSPAELSKVMKDAEPIIQTPVTFPPSLEGMSFGLNPTMDDDEVPLTDLGVVSPAPVVAPVVAPVSDLGGFGDFGDFSGFGDFTSVTADKTPSSSVSEPPSKAVVEDVFPSFTFGGLGDTPLVPSKDVIPDAPISPAGWGTDFNISLDDSTFSDILKSDNVKFGQ